MIEARPNRNALRQSARAPARRDRLAACSAARTSCVHGVPGLSTNSGKGSPVGMYRKTPGCTRSGLVTKSDQAPAPGRGLTDAPRPRPHPKSTQPPRVQRQHRAPPRRRPPLPAVRPAGPGGWRRPGRLHAPEAARTGPVSASRRSHVLMPRGGAGSTGKWPLTGFLAGESPNQTWGAMLTDLNGHKAVGIILPTTIGHRTQ